jgi:iron-sulfur cluster repair protein YtfE (RIC family)
MKATSLLKRQHRQTERLFKQLQRSKDEGERMELVTELANALSAHMMIEEQIFYPAAQQVLEGKKALLGEGAVLEHQMAKIALQNVLAEGQVSFEARLKVLRDLIEHHVEEEEELMFPEIEARMEDTELKVLGARMQEMHEQAVAAGHQKALGKAVSMDDMMGGAGQTNGSTKARATANGESRSGTRSAGRASARA